MLKQISNSGRALLLVLSMILAPLFAHAETANEIKPVDMKELVFGHIGDAYSWHITTIGDTHVTIPLLCIVYGNNGLDVFCSSKLGHEGHYTEYNGYKIAEAGQPNEGKIVDAATGERPWDFSITKNVLSLLISCGLMLWIFLSIANKYKADYKARPTGMQGLFEPLIISLQKDVIEPCIGKDAYKFSPFLLTVFFFIMINNYLGVIPIFPGGANLTGNIACTLVLATLTFLITNIFASKHYWMDIVWPEVPVGLKCPVPLMQLIEFIGIFTKPIALCIRLFANMLAGHIMVLVLIGIIFFFYALTKGSVLISGGIGVLSWLLVVFMTLLEFLVCFIQAYVFMTLSALFIGLAHAEPEHHGETKEA